MGEHRGRTQPFGEADPLETGLGKPVSDQFVGSLFWSSFGTIWLQFSDLFLPKIFRILVPFLNRRASPGLSGFAFSSQA